MCSIACIAILAAARPASPWEPTHGQPGIGERASLRILQPDYQGSDTSAEQYLFESIALPSVYVVHGFPDRQTPQPFGDFTSAQDMADIIAHLMTFR